MEYDDLADPGVRDLVVPAHDRLQVNVADGASGEAPKLQMDESLRIRNRDSVAGNADHLTRADEPHQDTGSSTSPPASTSRRVGSVAGSTVRRMDGNRGISCPETVLSSRRASGAPMQ